MHYRAFEQTYNNKQIDKTLSSIYLQQQYEKNCKQNQKKEKVISE